MRNTQAHHHHRDNLRRDVGLLVVSILVAVVLAKTGALGAVLAATHERRFLGSFLAGAFFISAFTAAPAAVVLAELSQANSIWLVAAVGALGSLTGDYVIFRFVRDSLSEDLLFLLRQRPLRRWRAILRLRSARWFLFFLGALIIASPLPDELGITLLGFARTRRRIFFLVSYAANFLGIFTIALAAKALAG